MKTEFLRRSKWFRYFLFKICFWFHLLSECFLLRFLPNPFVRNSIFLMRFIVQVSLQHNWNIIKLNATKWIGTRLLHALQPLCGTLLFFPIFYGAPESMAVFYRYLWRYKLKTQYQKPLRQYCHPLLYLRGIFPSHQSGQY